MLEVNDIVPANGRKTTSENLQKSHPFEYIFCSYHFIAILFSAFHKKLRQTR